MQPIFALVKTNSNSQIGISRFYNLLKDYLVLVVQSDQNLKKKFKKILISDFKFYSTIEYNKQNWKNIKVIILILKNY